MCLAQLRVRVILPYEHADLKMTGTECVLYGGYQANCTNQFTYVGDRSSTSWHIFVRPHSVIGHIFSFSHIEEITCTLRFAREFIARLWTNMENEVMVNLLNKHQRICHSPLCHEDETLHWTSCYWTVPNRCKSKKFLTWSVKGNSQKTAKEPLAQFNQTVVKF